MPQDKAREWCVTAGYFDGTVAHSTTFVYYQDDHDNDERTKEKYKLDPPEEWPVLIYEKVQKQAYDLAKSLSYPADFDWINIELKQYTQLRYTSMLLGKG